MARTLFTDLGALQDKQDTARAVFTDGGALKLSASATTITTRVVHHRHQQKAS